MKFSTFILLTIFMKIYQSRKLWEPPLPEISVTTVQKKNPIKLQNSEDKIQIADLSGTLYSDSLSELHLNELRIIRNQIRQIERGALCPSENLKILEIDFSRNTKPPTLTKNMFDNCDLKEVVLKFDYNNPSKIDQNALEGLVNLKTLIIDSLNVTHLKKQFLMVGRNLTNLVLSNIHVSKIDVDVFSDLINLEEVEIVHNLELTHLPRGIFKNLGKLKRLVLTDNALKNLSWDEFEGLISLEELDVVDNHIGRFDADKIAKNMPKIRKLFMELNPVGCKQKQDFVTLLKAKLNHSVEVPERYADIYGPCQ